MQKRSLLLLLTFIVIIILTLLSQCLEWYPTPTIYAITPTYARPTQQAELTRLAHIFLLVPNLHWIIVEDSNRTGRLVKNLLAYAGVQDRCTHLQGETPHVYREQFKRLNRTLPYAVTQHNIGLSWLRSNAKPAEHAIVYFMDTDYTYSLELFHEMSKLDWYQVGVWPVGLTSDGLVIERPLVNIFNWVIGFNAMRQPERPFPIDIAGFAIHLSLLFKYPLAAFSYDSSDGHLESDLLLQLTTRKLLQPLANRCQNVLVWHTPIQVPRLRNATEDVPT